MTCFKVSSPTPNTSPGATPPGPIYNTEKECLEACKEGACCGGSVSFEGRCEIAPKCYCESLGGNFQGIGTTCNEKIGACCDASQGFRRCIQITECACGGPNRTFYGIGTKCQTGACCVTNGATTTCEITTECACTGEGKTFYGVNTTCEFGACCVPNGASAFCQVLPKCVCESLNGTFKGVGTTCTADIKCTGACCLQDNGGCAQTTQAGCDELFGNYRGTGSDCFQPATNNNPSTAIITITGVKPNMIPWPEPGSFYFLNGAADYPQLYALNRTVTIPISCPQNVPVCNNPPIEIMYFSEVGRFTSLYDLAVKFYVLDGSCEPRFITLGETTSYFPEPTFGGYRKDFDSGYVGCNRSQRPELCGMPYDLTDAEVTITYV